MIKGPELVVWGSLPTETKVESGTSQSRSGTSVNLSYTGVPAREDEGLVVRLG